MRNKEGPEGVAETHPTTATLEVAVLGMIWLMIQTPHYP